MSKPSYATYIRHRVSGIEPMREAAEMGRDVMIGLDLLEHPDFAAKRNNFSATAFPGCVGPLKYKGHGAARTRHRASEGGGGQSSRPKRS